MTKFYVGQKVLVTGNSYYGFRNKRWDKCVGKICEVNGVENGRISIYNPDEIVSCWFKPSDLELITEAPEEITVNGVTYVRKPEPEHEWKFGDVAVHEDYGVVWWDAHQTMLAMLGSYVNQK